ncbi:MAG: glycosyltransferase family 2 protein [Chitinivibrionales bacterium]|nr:glycosyltransferase family 2 protein [Chitinivibrionales bacterium]
MKVSIVVPLLNEKENLPLLMDAIAAMAARQDFACEVVFVDDGSKDGSFFVLQQLYNQYKDAAGRVSVRVYRFARNYGKSAALSVGISKSTGDVVVTMDADLQDDPVAIPAMLKMLDGGYDMISGWKQLRHDPITKTLPSKLWNVMTSFLSGLRLHDFNCGFKAYRAAVARSLDIYGERHRYLPVLAHWDGFNVGEMAVPHHPRKFGKSKYGSMMRFFYGLFDMLTILFLRNYMKSPLHFFGLAGMMLGFLGSGILAYFGVVWMMTGVFHIRPLVLLALGAIIVGFQFISLGLIGEMITQAAPKNTYLVKDSLEG